MDAKLFVNHSIFLTESQRKSLKESATFDVIGVSVPVYLNDTEPSKEVFCQYTITSYPLQTNIIIKHNSGYIVNLGETGTIEALQNIKDGGCQEANFAQNTDVLHQILIQDISVLRDSLSFLKLD